MDCVENIPKVDQTTGTVEVFICFQTFRDPLREELPRVQIFMSNGPGPTRSREIPSCSAIVLAEIWRSPKIAREFDQ